MAQKRVRSSRFTGVYWRETADSGRRHNGRPDKCFDFCYRDASGKLKWITVGWLSGGVTEQAAANARRLALSAPAEAVSINSFNIQQNDTNHQCLLKDAAESYFRWLEGEGKYSKAERCRYGLHIQGYFADKAIGELRISDIDSFKQHLQTKLASSAIVINNVMKGNRKRKVESSRPCLSADMVRKILGLCRAIINHAIRVQMWGGINPFSRERGLSMPRTQNKGERFLSPDEARCLLDEIEKRSPQLWDMTFLSLRTGLRSTEIFKLRGGDIDRKAGVLWLEAKGGKREQVFVDSEILEMLENYNRSPSELVFISKTGKPLTQISDTFMRSVGALGLNDGVKDNRQKVWFHTLRHTFASWLAQSGTVTLHELRDIMRHQTIVMTERYAHLIPGATQERVALVGEILKCKNMNAGKPTFDLTAD